MINDRLRNISLISELKLFGETIDGQENVKDTFLFLSTLFIIYIYYHLMFNSILKFKAKD